MKKHKILPRILITVLSILIIYCFIWLNQFSPFLKIKAEKQLLEVNWANIENKLSDFEAAQYIIEKTGEEFVTQEIILQKVDTSDMKSFCIIEKHRAEWAELGAWGETYRYKPTFKNILFPIVEYYHISLINDYASVLIVGYGKKHVNNLLSEITSIMNE